MATAIGTTSKEILESIEETFKILLPSAFLLALVCPFEKLNIRNS